MKINCNSRINKPSIKCETRKCVDVTPATKQRFQIPQILSEFMLVDKINAELVNKALQGTKII